MFVLQAVTAMGLDKAIKSGKEHRQPYRKSKAIDGSCVNHGSCPWCTRNRTHSARKRQDGARQQMADLGSKDNLV